MGNRCGVDGDPWISSWMDKRGGLISGLDQSIECAHPTCWTLIFVKLDSFPALYFLIATLDLE